MAVRLLAATVPAVVASASALVWWLCNNGRPDEAEAAPGDLRVVPPDGSLATQSPDEISVVTYNCLADVFASKLDAAPQHLDWRSQRWPLLQSQLLTWAADLVMLQEVDVAMLQEWLELARSAGYAATHQEPKGKQVVCLTLHKPRLQLWWADAGRSRSLPAAFLFTDSSGALQALYTLNLHLEGSPYKPAERVRQLRASIAALVKHQATAGLPPAECSVIVGGDLNSGRHEGPVRLLLEGWLPAGYREAHLPSVTVVPEAADTAAGGADVTQPYALSDAYVRRPLPCTRKVPQLASHIDWLLVSQHLSVTAVLWPLDVRDPADARLPHSRSGLPNAAHPSDHLPLGAVVRVLPAGVLQQA